MDRQRTGKIRLTVFLGNPGPDYRLSRHNFGWLLAERLEERHSISWKQKFKGSVAEIRMGGSLMRLLRPEGYMNRSGESVQACSRFFRVDPENILIVHDDIEMDFGRFAIKQGGGLAGHNGLRSIATQLGTREFYRLRLGVSRPDRGSVSDYVLKPFSRMEIAELPGILDKAAQMLEDLPDYP